MKSNQTLLRTDQVKMLYTHTPSPSKYPMDVTLNSSRNITNWCPSIEVPSGDTAVQKIEYTLNISIITTVKL